MNNVNNKSKKAFQHGRCLGSNPDFMNFIVSDNGDISIGWEYTTQEKRDESYEILKRACDEEGDGTFDIYKGRLLANGDIELVVEFKCPYCVRRK